MASITIPKNKYEILRRKASLYEAILRALPERRWGVEDYSPQRISEFARKDRLDEKTRLRLKKILNA